VNIYNPALDEMKR